MAELTISAADIASALKNNLDGYTPSVEARTVGRVAEVGDGIARVSGLPDAAVNELLEFEDGSVGLALNLDENSIGAVVLGDVEHIEEGQTVKSTGGILSMPVGDALLGRVVNALGRPVDGQGEIVGAIDRRMEIQAPGILGRKPVHEPLQTGIKAIDAMTPIGRGQRELIIGAPKAGVNLCCGLAGRAYALLNLYRLTGDNTWLNRARSLGKRAAVHSRQPQTGDFEGFENSLYKGDIGVAALIVDLEQPDLAAMPFFENING